MRRYTDEEVEARVVPELVKAIYPILIPVEEQSCQIQAENHAEVTRLATELWRSFRKG